MRGLHRNVVCHHTSSNLTAHRRSSRCVVGQTSKAKASNSFSVMLGDPATLRFLHVYSQKPTSTKKHACIGTRTHFLMLTDHAPSFTIWITCDRNVFWEEAFYLLPKQHPDAGSQLGICHSCLDLWSLSHPIPVAPTSPTQPLLMWHLWKCTPVRFVTKISMMEAEPHRERWEVRMLSCFYSLEILCSGTLVPLRTCNTSVSMFNSRHIKHCGHFLYDLRDDK